MKFVLITDDDSIESAAQKAYPPTDELLTFVDWKQALEASENADLMFLDMISILEPAHKVSAYEEFANAKMAHPIAKEIKLVLIAPPADYEMDFMMGWPGFVFAHVRRPIDERIFRRAATWV